MILLLLACVGDVPDPVAIDRGHYLAALDQRDLLQGAAECRQIHDAYTRGDCISGLQVKVSPRDPQLCEELAPAGLWRDECWFTTADDPDADFATRWSRCQGAGAFASACHRHQRLRAADKLGRRRGSPLLQRLDRVEEIMALEPRPTAEERDEAWRGFWRAHHLAHQGVDPAACADLSADRAATCLAATRGVVEHRATQALHERLMGACQAVDHPEQIPLMRNGPTLGPDPQVAEWARAAVAGSCRR